MFCAATCRMGVGLREVMARGDLMLWLAFLKSVAAILGIVKVKPFHTVHASISETSFHRNREYPCNRLLQIYH